MIRLNKFEFHSPTSLNDAVNILSSSNGETKILAGGTDVLVGMKQGVLQPKHILWLGKIKELRNISFSIKDGLKIGAMCTLAEIEQNENVKKYFPSIIDAVKSIASPQIRNSATIGGNLCLNTRCFYYDQSDFWRTSLGNCLKYGDGICHAAPELSRCTAVFSSDLAPILIALNSVVELQDANSTRKISLEQFYNDDGKNHVLFNAKELLTTITIPFNPEIKSAHQKMRMRNSIDFAIANAGVAVSLREKNVCNEVKIVVGAVSSKPIIATEVSKKLEGKEITEQLIQQVAIEISSLIHPMPNVDSAVSYRKKMVRALVERALRKLIMNTGSNFKNYF